MVTMAAMVSVPILINAVTQAALRGEPAEAARRGLGVPVAVGVGMVAAQALLSALLAACSWASQVLVIVGAGGEKHLTEVWGRLATTLASPGELASSAAGMPGAASALLLLIAALAALTVWVELSVRASLLYLLAAMVPLALAGLFWRRLATWAIRLGEVILAVALSQVVITAALEVGTTVVDQGLRTGQAPGATVGGLLAGVAKLAAGAALGPAAGAATTGAAAVRPPVPSGTATARRVAWPLRAHRGAADMPVCYYHEDAVTSRDALDEKGNGRCQDSSSEP